jgi:hypothetical protein
MAFTVPAVPTGMKAGVRMTPRGIEIAPVRAAPSRAWTEKLKAAVSVNLSVFPYAAAAAPTALALLPSFS